MPDILNRHKDRYQLLIELVALRRADWLFWVCWARELNLQIRTGYVLAS